MAENQKENHIYFFSKKVLLLSLLFLLINVALYGLVLYKQKNLNFNEVAPKIVFDEESSLMIKTPFDSEYFAARPNQTILIGSYIKTGDKNQAVIELKGNIIRLDENTEIQLVENNFQTRDSARFVFKLDSGGVWVNAFDPIIILTPQSQARFAHTVGAYLYSGQLNRIFSVSGNIDTVLSDNKGNSLAKFVVPLKNQIAFANSQITQDYTRLEYSKLKKELKMGPVSQEILDDVWIKNNTSDYMSQTLAGNNYIYSFTDYNFRSNYHSLRAQLALIPGRKRIELLNLVTVKLKYLLGGVNISNDLELAKTILDEFSTLSEQFKDDPLFNDLVETQFYAIGNVRTDTPSYLTKEKLRGYLLDRDKNPEILRTYLAGMDYLLRVGEVGQCEKAAEKWLEQWEPGFKNDYRDEFDQQSRIYHSIILAYIDKISPKFLSILDDIGDYRLENAINRDETLYEIALERLEVSQYFVSVYRYTDAKTYLKTSYSKLNLAEIQTASAAKEVFIQNATLLADRIAFAEQSLKGASESIDEAKFRAYLSDQERDNSLTERWNEFILETQKPAEQPVVYPTIEDVSGLFAQNRITVLDDDIIADPENKFEFDIQNGRFLDRADDNTQITFSARLNYSSQAVYNLILDEKPLRGSFTLADFISVAKAGDKKLEIEHLPEPDDSKLPEFLDQEKNEEILRSQIISQDLAVRLMIKEMEQYRILIPTSQQVTILNTTTLTEFKITNVFIEDPETKRKVQVSFEYNSDTEIISRITLKEGVTLDLPSQIKATDFVKKVFGALFGQEQKIEETQNAVTEITNIGFTLDASNISFPSDSYSPVDFKDIRLKAMPIKISGQYDRNSKNFIKAEHTLLNSSSIDPKTFISQLAELWVIDYLKSKGIVITKENIITPLPAEKVEIKNYTRGLKILNFTFNTIGNNLTDISAEGLDTVVKSMTFEEFSLVEKDAVSRQVPPPAETQSVTANGTCGDFADRLKDCIKYSCEFPDPTTGVSMIRRVSGLLADKCRYIEQMPDNKYMECNYTTDYRSAIAQQHKDQLTLGNIITASSFGAEPNTFTYTINGITVANPAKEALTNGECIIDSQ